MRLWTLHPRYLDTQGLLAVWREGLLAQLVLQGKTKGYRNHPQLIRFDATGNPTGAIAEYLRALHREALSRGYRFNDQRILLDTFAGTIACTRGQLLYEWNHFRNKVRSRDVDVFGNLELVVEPEAHPIFSIVEGGVEHWERRQVFRTKLIEPKCKNRNQA